VPSASLARPPALRPGDRVAVPSVSGPADPARLEVGLDTLRFAGLAERLGGLGMPMIAWGNVGHGGHFQTFPVGVAAELDADRGTLRLPEPPLVPNPGVSR